MQIRPAFASPVAAKLARALARMASIAARRAVRLGIGELPPNAPTSLAAELYSGTPPFRLPAQINVEAGTARRRTKFLQGRGVAAIGLRQRLCLSG
jgi:hypothetical protein